MPKDLVDIASGEDPAKLMELIKIKTQHENCVLCPTRIPKTTNKGRHSFDSVTDQNKDRVVYRREGRVNGAHILQKTGVPRTGSCFNKISGSISIFQHHI